eukprot:m.246001 g.246001  ORF g.246001 m.246001 type:complete len:400 (+) comp19482_c0_seq1:114-1313(+)
MFGSSAIFHCLFALSWRLATCQQQGLPPPPGYPNCTRGSLPKQFMYKVSVTDRDPVPNGAALISHVNGTSVFNFSFTTAWFPAPPGSGTPDGLIVRVVECSPNHHSCAGVPHPEWTNAGALATVGADLSATSTPTTQHITQHNIRWPGTPGPPHSDTGRWGAADPRLTFRAKDKTYYLTWDNCTHNCEPTRSTLLSTTKDPFSADGWTLHGPVLPGAYTGGASLLFRDDAGDDATHYAFVSDSNTAGTIKLAESHDGITWKLPTNVSRQTFMTGRPDCWDKAVATGPQPERLSNGDYLYVYNIDTGFPYHPNPLGRCSVGWAILDGSDPTRVVARADEPLITPTLPWEQCPHKGYTCQETMVVFSTGLKPLGNDEFYVIYGGADTDVGLTRIKVDVNAH